MSKRLAVVAPALLAFLLAGCGAAQKDAKAATQPLEGDAALIASAQKISDALGGCAAASAADSKVVGLENGAIIMIACAKTTYASTSRLFSAKAGAAPVLLSQPDYDASGWFASDQAWMPEIDAGAGTLTTLHKSNEKGTCGSEATYKWDGSKFAVQEMRWKDCADGAGAPPFPLIWPAVASASVEPGSPTPAP